jgi:hypothetical protein
MVQLALPPKSEITKAIGFALQGDAMTEKRSLLDMPPERFQGEDAAFRECMVDSFAGEAAPSMDLDIHDTWVASLRDLLGARADSSKRTRCC